jgi:3D (Asp-Asp-Asp) domain-containing protein
VAYTLSVLTTAYSSTVDQTDDSPFITASGTHVHNGTLACNFLRFGTRVRIPQYYGDKVFIVEDRMAKRFSHKMDIWMETREEAIQFGARTVKVEVLIN